MEGNKPQYRIQLYINEVFVDDVIDDVLWAQIHGYILARREKERTAQTPGDNPGDDESLTGQGMEN